MLSKTSFAVAAIAFLGFGAMGCGVLGAAHQGQLPAPLHETPTPGEVAESPCRYGDVDRCATLCRGGEASACNSTGVLLEFADTQSTDASRAARFYEAGCAGDFGPACNNLGWLYALGRGVPRVEKQAMALFTRAYDAFRLACLRGDAQACMMAGEMLRDGRGVEENDEDALALFERACTGGAQRACAEAGDLRVR